MQNCLALPRQGVGLMQSRPNSRKNDFAIPVTEATIINSFLVRYYTFQLCGFVWIYEV